MSEEAVTQAPEAPAEAPEGSPEGAAPAAPSVDVDALKGEYEAQVARALNAAKERERELFELKQQYEGTTSKLSELEKLREELKSNPLKALEQNGVTYDALTRDILDGKYDPMSPEDQKRAEQEREIRELKEQLEEFRGQYTEATESAAFQADLSLVREAASGEDFAALRAIATEAEYEHLTKVLRDEVKEGKQVDVSARLKEAQDGALQRLRQYVGSEPILKALVSDPSIKEALTRALQASGEGNTSDSESDGPTASEAGDGAGNGLRTITNDVAASGASRGRASALSEDERRQRAAAKLDAILRAKREKRTA